MIKLQVIGNLGKDCSVNTVNGKNVINFSVAHSEKFKDSQGNQQEKTIWVECSWWLENTKVAAYLVKGAKVYVEGQPEARSYMRNDGTAGGSLSVRVKEMKIVSFAGGEFSQNPATTGTEPIDDLPF